MKSFQIVTFVVDKNLDIKNHFIALKAYKRNKDRGFMQNKEESSENLLKLVRSEDFDMEDENIRVQIEKSIEQYYKKENKLFSIVDDINKEWIKIEKDVIQKLEEIHKFPFPYTSIKGILSSANRFGYNSDEGWFATNMRTNKFICIDVATHELMHFMFHKYYDQVCIENGLNRNQMWDVKEAFSVLLNVEFDKFRFQSDSGKDSPIHTALREVIKNSWEKKHDFDITLREAIEYIKSV
jgi:hypothetical protein